MVLTAALAMILAGCGSQIEKGVFAAPWDMDENADGEQASWKSFTAQDIEGNPIDESIFAQADLTMVNIWMTSCRPCIRELGSLNRLAGKYKDRDVQVVGIVLDVMNAEGTLSEEKVEKVKSILDQKKVKYLQLVPSPDLVQIRLNKVFATPETVFVDREGNEVGSVMGARDYDRWTEMIDKKLERMDEGE